MPSSSPPRSTQDADPSARQAYHRPRTTLGAAGHWVKTAGILAPLVIGELVKDPEQKWRLVRMSAVATALVSEGLYASRIRREREEREQQRGR